MIQLSFDPHLEGPESNEHELEKEDIKVVSDMMGKSTHLMIEKIEKWGSIAMKQKDWKQSSAFPAKAKQFFISINEICEIESSLKFPFKRNYQLQWRMHRLMKPLLTQ